MNRPAVVVAEMPAGAMPEDVPTDPLLRAVRVLVPPDDVTGARVAATVLAALDRRPDVHGSSWAARAWRFRCEWLEAHDTEWLVILSAQDLGPRNTRTLVDTARRSGTNLALVADLGSLGRLQDASSRHGSTTVEWDGLMRLLRTTAVIAPPSVTAPAPAADDRDLPAPADLPVQPWPEFRSRCRATLTPAEAAAVEAVYDIALRRAYARLDERAGLVVRARNHAAVQEKTVLRDDVFDLLSAVAAEHSRQSALVVAMHATAAAFATRGLRFSFVADKLLSTLDGGMAPPAPHDDDWVLLRGFHQPWHAAACVLVGLGVPHDEILGVRVAEVAADGSVFRSDGKPTTVPAGARPYLRAQRISRRTDGAMADEAFLPQALLPRRVSRAVKAARTDLGVRIAHTTEGQGKLLHESTWRDRVGFSVDVV